MQVKIINDDDFFKIHYHNNQGMTYRILVLDKNKSIIQDELFEYDTDGKHIANVVFATDYITIIGMRKYTQNGFEDYRRINNQLTLTQAQKTQWLDNQKAKTSFYNCLGELVYYDIFENDKDCGMVIMGSFDKNDVQFYWDNPPNEVKFLQSYSDY